MIGVVLEVVVVVVVGAGAAVVVEVVKVIVENVWGKTLIKSGGRN